MNTPKHYVKYTSLYSDADPIYYICDYYKMPITDMIKITGKSYLNAIFHQYRLFDLYKSPFISPVGLN